MRPGESAEVIVMRSQGVQTPGAALKKPFDDWSPVRGPLAGSPQPAHNGQVPGPAPPSLVACGWRAYPRIGCPTDVNVAGDLYNSERMFDPQA